MTRWAGDSRDEGTVRMARMRTYALVAAGLTLAAALPSSAATPAWTPTLVLEDEGRSALSAFGDGTVIFSLASAAADRLARSTDGGRTWTDMPPVPEPNSGVTRFATPRTGWSLGLQRVYVTRDAGARWSRAAALPSDGGPAQPFALGVAEGTSTVVVAGTANRKTRTGCNYPTSGVVWTSQDGGRRWLRGNLGAGTLPVEVRPYDKRHAVALAYDVSFADRDPQCLPKLLSTSVWLTGDGGRTWRRVHRCRTYCTTATIVTPGRLLVGRNDGTTSRSDDSGRTWREAQPLTAGNAFPAGTDLGQTFWVNAFAFADARTGYASTKGGGTWRTTDGGRTWQNEVSPDYVYGGFGSGDVAVIDAQRAVVGGLRFVSVRTSVG